MRKRYNVKLNRNKILNLNFLLCCPLSKVCQKLEYITFCLKILRNCINFNRQKLSMARNDKYNLKLHSARMKNVCDIFIIVYFGCKILKNKKNPYNIFNLVSNMRLKFMLIPLDVF